MQKIISITFLFLSVLFSSCTNSQPSNTNLSAVDFNKKIESLPEGNIVDVRTTQEFSEGHIKNAVNIDWNGSAFDAQISKVDKTKPVFVYCLGGGRSASAASKMREMGFKEVYELNGGMMAWRSSGLAETKDASVAAKPEGMSKAEFDKLIVSDKAIIVDFYAEWCPPCKKMRPHLDEISKEMANEVLVIKIDVDKNPTLAQEMKVEGLPTLQFYKAGKLSSTKLGYLTKEELIQQAKL